MNAVGIDVSKGKSMVAIMAHLENWCKKTFKISYVASELEKLAGLFESLNGETCLVI